MLRISGALHLVRFNLTEVRFWFWQAIWECVRGRAADLGYEGDPMELVVRMANTCIPFYQWLKRDFDADAILHFGMHGALEFMPGKQVGVNGADWLIA